MIENKKNEIAKAVSSMEFYPEILDEKYELTNTKKFPIGNIASLGAGFEPLAAAFNYVTSGGKAVSGLYKVTIPPGTSLSAFKDGSGYLGSVVNNGSFSQARLNPLVVDPATVAMAIAIKSITDKLETIQELQEEMLSFLIQKERSELKGDLNFLTDTINNYKYNWNNEKYKNHHHIKTLDIKQASERKIDFYKEQITAQLKKKKLFNSDADVKKEINRIQNEFKDYQLALYLFAFSSFLEVMLLENFDSKYLTSITNKIEKQSLNYRELYTTCYDKIESDAKNSIETHLLNGVAGLSNIFGKAIEKTPIISKGKVDEALIESGQKLKDFNKKRSLDKMQVLIANQYSYVRPFIENIETMDQMYNYDINLIFDKDNLYIDIVN